MLKYRSKTAAAALEEEPGENMPLPKGVNPARAVGKQARQLLGHFYALEARSKGNSFMTPESITSGGDVRQRVGAMKFRPAHRLCH